MEINYVIWNVRLTGGIRVYFEIVNRLVERDHNVTVSVITGDPSWFPLKAKIIHINEHFKYGSLLNVLYSIFSLAKKIPDCDINVAGWPFSVYPVYLSRKGTIKIHSMLHYENLFFKGLAEKMINLTYKLPFYIIVNSSWLQRILKEKHNKDSFLINPGINLKVFYPRKVKKPEMKRIVCLGKDTVRWKGIPEALKAMKIVLKKRKDVELVFLEQPH
ncbi:MAG: hypothetical protein QXD43_00165 [Candidatus Aenigmatarchaeota archaeon]